MIHTDKFHGLLVKTGDILCTRDGTDQGWFGLLWQLAGYLVPGPIDHVIMYVGPNGRCVEAGGKGVIEFEMPHHQWDAQRVSDRRYIADRLVGVAYPLSGLGVAANAEEQLRANVADYCLNHIGKPYNANFLNTVTDEAFYCSQLIYLAYRAAGIDLGTRPVQVIADSQARESPPIVLLPTQLMRNCAHQRL